MPFEIVALRATLGPALSRTNARTDGEGLVTVDLEGADLTDSKKATSNATDTGKTTASSEGDAANPKAGTSAQKTCAADVRFKLSGEKTST